MSMLLPPGCVCQCVASIKMYLLVLLPLATHGRQEGPRLPSIYEEDTKNYPPAKTLMLLIWNSFFSKLSQILDIVIFFSTTENILNSMNISDFFRWLYHWKTDLSWCIPVPSCLCLVQHKCHTDTLASTEGGHTRLACCPRPEARQGDPTRPTTKKGPPTAACIDPNTSMGTAWPTLTLLQMAHFTSLLVCPQLHTHASQLRQL